MFATVCTEGNVLWVRVVSPAPKHGEFSDLVTRCEEMYLCMRRPFALALDLSLMERIHPFDAMQWMAMFFRVMPVTRQFLVMSLICFRDNLSKPVEEFLKLYDPVKPMRLFATVDDLELAVGRYQEECAKSAPQ